MSQIITPTQMNQPRIVTLAELRAKLLPLTKGDVWAQKSIVDLFCKGAPIPQKAGEPERRILIPQQFELWFNDFSKRVGIGANGASVYNNMQRHLRTH